MATKAELVAEQSNAQASLIVNNAFIDGLSRQLEEKTKYGLTFPKDYNPTNELMGAYLTLKETLDSNKKCVLESCSQASIANTLMTMVTMGVSMTSKQCYAVSYQGKLNCQMSVYGNTCIARRFGMKNITSMCIYEGDDFQYHIEDGEIVIDKHTQNFENIDNDKIKGAYAVATMEDGSKHIEVMNMAMIKKAWSQGYGYKEDGKGTHQKFADQMAEKTVKNRCLKYIIRTHGNATVSDAMDEIDSHEGARTIEGEVKHEVETFANKEKMVVEEEPTPIEKVEADVVSDDDLPDFLK